jgi:hypothetical protein
MSVRGTVKAKRPGRLRGKRVFVGCKPLAKARLGLPCGVHIVKVEQFHHVLKSGCAVEKLQERGMEKTTALVLMYSINSGAYYEHNLYCANTSAASLYRMP